MALEQMDGFELAGRTVSFCKFDSLAISYTLQLRVNTVHEKGVAVAGATMSGRSMGNQAESLDEGGNAFLFAYSDVFLNLGQAVISTQYLAKH